MKYNNIWRFLIAVVLAAALALPLPAAPAKAAPAITLSRSQGAIGQIINISGSGFVTNNSSRGVHVLFGKYPGSNTTMDYQAAIYKRAQTFEMQLNGTFSGSFAVPARLDGGLVKEDVSRGNYFIYVTYYFPPTQFTAAYDDLAIQVMVPFTVVSGTVTLDPTSGPVGTEININGTFFGAQENISVLYDSVAANYTGDKDTDASGTFGPTRLKIPPGIAGAHSIAVSGASSGLFVLANFTVKPSISLSSASNVAGSTITLSGSGFAGNSAIASTFGGNTITPAGTDAFGSFTTAFPVPSQPPAVYNIVSTDASGNSATTSFTVSPSGININPASGNAATQVTVNGIGFVAGRSVTITFAETNVATATADAQGGFSAAFAVPQVKTGSYEIKATDGTNASSVEFSVLLDVVIGPVTSPTNPGYVGTEITISGEGGIPDSPVTVTYDGREVAKGIILPDRTFTIAFSAPASGPSEPREHTVIANIGSEIRQSSFFMEAAAPPIPVPLEPRMEERTVAAASFVWEAVEDLSGVTYTLQIATDEEFPAGSVTLEKTGLTQTNYTLSAEEKLKALDKDASYFWRVSAIDGAGNAGEWSGSGRFFVGISFRLSQPLIYLLVGIGALALIIFAFWIGRRTAYY